jgi:hypothetical protein
VICGLLLVLSRPALVRSKCPRLVASEFGWFLTMAAVIPGNWTQPLAMALAKVEDVGDPIAALKNDTFWSLEADFGKSTDACWLPWRMYKSDVGYLVALSRLNSPGPITMACSLKNLTLEPCSRELRDTKEIEVREVLVFE